MTAHIEWLVGSIRAGKDFIEFGDPYTFTATVIRRGDTAEIIAASGVIYPGMLRDIKKALAEVGITKFTWDRRKAGGDRHIEGATHD